MDKNQDRGMDLISKGGIKFIEKTHKYVNGNNVRYSSFSSEIKKYCEPFDGEKISKYKSIKDLFEQLGKMDLIKERVKKSNNGRYDFNKVHLLWDSLCCTKFKDKLIEKKKYYQDLWIKNANDGSIEHGIREENIYKNGYEFNGKIYPYINKSIFDINKDDVGVVPEMLLWSHKHQFGGLADVPIFDKGVVHIEDFKTNKSIEYVGFNNKVMKRELSHLQDCNFVKYSLQLNFYMELILMLRPDLKRGECNLIHTKSEIYNRNEDTKIKCLNLKNEVDIMLNNREKFLKEFE